MIAKALELVDVSKSFGGLKACQDIGFSVASGERHLILGPNGAGKTTLFNMISGDLPVSAGTIRCFGQDVAGLPPHARAQLGMARTYQILTLFESSSVLHNVMLAVSGVRAGRLNPLKAFDADAGLREDSIRVLAELGLEDLAASRVSECSYGDKRRLEIALALAQKPRLMLLDEPLAGLSVEERGRVAQLLKGISRETTVVLIEHDMDVALGLADNLTLLNFGRHVLSGPKDAVVNDPRTKEVYLA